MKITSKVSKAAPAPVKVVKTGKQQKVSGPVAHLSYTVTHVKALFKAGLDGAGAWLGKQIQDKLVTDLINHRDKITSTRLAKSDKVLFVSAARAYAWPLLSNSGDIYERTSDKTPVRGLLSSLKRAYGEKNVRIVSKQEAVKLLKTHKSEPASLKAFGIA